MVESEIKPGKVRHGVHSRSFMLDGGDIGDLAFDNQGADARIRRWNQALQLARGAAEGNRGHVVEGEGLH